MAGKCGVCRQIFDPKHISTIQCGHLFHRDCIEGATQTAKVCPTCQGPFNLIVQQLFFEIDCGQDRSDQLVTDLSNEIRKLRKDLQEARGWQKEFENGKEQVKELRTVTGKNRLEIARLRRRLVKFDDLIEKDRALLDMCERLVEVGGRLRLLFRCLGKRTDTDPKTRSQSRSKQAAKGKQETSDPDQTQIEQALCEIKERIATLDQERVGVDWDPKRLRPMPSRMERVQAQVVNTDPPSDRDESDAESDETESETEGDGATHTSESESETEETESDLTDE